MQKQLLAPTRITDAQRKWLDAENIRTGNGLSAIIRGLIQDKITKDGKK